MRLRPGVPRLLRDLNDRAAFDVLLARGPLTRARIGELTGLSTVTAAQLLARLQQRGLVAAVGEQAAARGPSARLYAVRPDAVLVAGLEVGPARVTAAIGDLAGSTLAVRAYPLEGLEASANPAGGELAGGELAGGPAGGLPAEAVTAAVRRACEAAGVQPAKLGSVVLGTPGVIDPRTGDPRFTFDLPAWRNGLRAVLSRELACPVRVENDVNLAAEAERAYGVAADVDEFALLWAGRGVGLAVTIDGRLYRGRTGSAGEIGYLPVPGVPLATDVRREPGHRPAVSGGLQTLVGRSAMAELAAACGVAGQTPEEWFGSGDEGFLAQAAERFAVGVASVCAILDPGLVVLAGPVGAAGGERLAARVEEATARACLVRPEVRVAGVRDEPVVRGAVATAARAARDRLFGA